MKQRMAGGHVIIIPMGIVMCTFLYLYYKEDDYIYGGNNDIIIGRLALLSNNLCSSY